MLENTEDSALTYFKSEFHRVTVVIATAAVGLLLAAIRAYVVYTNYKFNGDGVTYYILPEAVPLLFAGVTAFCCILCVVMARGFSSEIAVAGNRIPLGMCLCSLLFAAAIVSFGGIVPFATVQTESPFRLVVLIAALLAAIRFVIYGAKLVYMKAKVFAWASLLPVIYYILRVLYAFTAQTAAPLDSSGTYRFLSMLATMLFLMLEGKIAAGNGSRFFYTVAGFFSLILIPVYALPAVILNLLYGIGSYSSMLYAVCDIAAFIYVFARLRIVCSQPADE